MNLRKLSPAFAFAFLLLAVACKPSAKVATKAPATTPPVVSTTPAKPTPPPPPPAVKKETGKLVLIKTDMGDIKIRLYDNTPLHRDNFIKLAKQGYFKDLLFHRVIKDFMIQGGDPNSRNAAPGVALGSGGPGYTVDAEFNPDNVHVKGAICAARLGDGVNPKKASSGSQFYIVQGKKATDAQLDQIEQRGGFKYTPAQREMYKSLGGTPFLDRGYTVFGIVVEGLDIVDKIGETKTQPGDRPVIDVKMDVSVIQE